MYLIDHKEKRPHKYQHVQHNRQKSQLSGIRTHMLVIQIDQVDISKDQYQRFKISRYNSCTKGIKGKAQIPFCQEILRHKQEIEEIRGSNHNWKQHADEKKRYRFISP